jgi:hypothetical protein
MGTDASHRFFKIVTPSGINALQISKVHQRFKPMVL